MARKYSKKASKKVESAVSKQKRGKLKSGSGKKVTSRKQAVAIGLSEARRSGAKVPKKSSTTASKQAGAKTSKKSRAKASKQASVKAPKKKSTSRKKASKKK